MFGIGLQHLLGTEGPRTVQTQVDAVDGEHTCAREHRKAGSEQPYHALSDDDDGRAHPDVRGKDRIEGDGAVTGEAPCHRIEVVRQTVPTQRRRGQNTLRTVTPDSPDGVTDLHVIVIDVAGRDGLDDYAHFGVAPAVERVAGGLLRLRAAEESDLGVPAGGEIGVRPAR